MEMCRLCLDIQIINTFSPLQGTHKDMLQVLVPELNLALTKDPVICGTCLDNVQKLHNFKSTCLEIENKLKNLCRIYGITSSDRMSWHNVLKFVVLKMDTDSEYSIKLDVCEDESVRTTMKSKNDLEIIDAEIKHVEIDIKSDPETEPRTSDRALRNCPSGLEFGISKMNTATEFGLISEVSDDERVENKDSEITRDAEIEQEEIDIKSDPETSDNITDNFVKTPLGTKKVRKECDSSTSISNKLLTEDHVDGCGDTVETLANKSPWCKKTACPYCCEEVTHFPRHLQRQHSTEKAVNELVGLSLKDPKRKELIKTIRRQGNFISSSLTKVVRPVRRPRCDETEHNLNENVKGGKDQFVACCDCLGFFKRGFLCRHRKKCSSRPKDENRRGRVYHLSQAQSFQMCSGTHSEFYNSLRLKKEVFKRMRADEISKAAMGDVLICSYAESVLRKNNRTQYSNKMRELGRLLLILRQTVGVRQLFDVLKPEYFDSLVSATKTISGYNDETKTFQASSLARHMGRTLKQVCNIANKLVMKKTAFLPCPEPEVTLKRIKRLKGLIHDHWNSEVSSLGLKDLNQRKWEKPKLIPLTSDVIKFNTYVTKVADEACSNIETGYYMPQQYRRLTEAVLVLTLLLNRKRFGEIQYLKINDFLMAGAQNHQEEYPNPLSESEKMLSQDFKRVVTGGKAILFSKNIQRFIKVLLTEREKCIEKANEYLFANPSSKDRWISGYHVLQKLAADSGVENKTLFTSTRLRKQIATVVQVLNLNETEMERFANFMGHTKKSHGEYYGLPQDINETAKISKLLMAINKGKEALYKGKQLDEIEFSDNVESDSDDETIPGIPETVSETTIPLNTTKHDLRDVTNKDSFNTNDDDSSSNMTSSPTSSKKYMSKPKITRKKWSAEQSNVIKEFFKGHIKNKFPPKKNEVEQFRSQYKPMFQDRNWVLIKTYVYNCYKKK